MKKPHKENVIAWVLGVLSIAVAAGLAYAITLVAAPIKISLGESDFSIQCLFHEETIAYADVRSVALSEEYKSKTKRGHGGQAKEFGVYRNDELGSHYRLTYTENDKNYIVCVKKDGSAIVFNQKTKAKTQELFEKLSERIDAVSRA